MPTSYTPLLGLALPTQGELDGTWGDTVNDYITKYVDAAVAGAQTISGSQTAVTLSTTTGVVLTQAGATSTGSAQYQIINCTGNPASLLTVTAPAVSKAYIVINATSTAQSVKLVGAGPTAGVTIAAGDKALIAWNGADFVRIGASAGGSNTQVQYNSGGNLAGSANLTFDGTILSANTLTGKLQAYTESVTTASVNTATYNINTNLSNIFDLTLSNNVTFTFTNPPAAGTSKPITVILRQDGVGNRTATFTGALYTDGVAPILSTGANDIDVLTFFTVNGGASWFGTFAMANVS